MIFFFYLDFGRSRLSKSSPKKNRFLSIGDPFVQVGKRFVKTSQDEHANDVAFERHEKSKIYFAQAHQKLLSRQEEIEKERRGRRQAQVPYIIYILGSLNKILFTIIFLCFTIFHVGFNHWEIIIAFVCWLIIESFYLVKFILPCVLQNLHRWFSFQYVWCNADIKVIKKKISK
jgi:hypothetical protein